MSVSLGAIATARIDCTGCLSKVESKVTPLSPVLNKPPVESPTKKIAGLRGSIAISETRPPIAAGPIERALKFLKRMSVNFGGATSETGEDAAEGDDGLVVGVPGKFGVSGAGEVGRAPPSVADGAWARALP